MLRRLFPRQLGLPQRRFFYDEERVNVTEFERKWIKFFQEECEDASEVQRGARQIFYDDLVPHATVLDAALRACRRHNTFATAARIFWSLRGAVNREEEYDEYVRYLQPTMDELGVLTSFQLGRTEIQGK